MANFESTLNTEFSNLYRRIAEDRRVQDAANAAKQDAVLRLVSTSLTESVEPVIGRIVNEQLTNMMVGPMKDIFVQTIDRNLSAAFAHGMKSVIPKEIERTLPVAMGQVSQQPGVLRAVADQLGSTIAQHMDGFIKSFMQEKMIPTYTQLAMQAAQSAVGQVEGQFNEQVRVFEVQREHDAAKIAHLMNSVNNLQETVNATAEQQLRFQSEVVNIIRQQAELHASNMAPQQVASDDAARQAEPLQAAQVQKTPEQIEREAIQQLIDDGQYEPAAIQWLQSSRQGPLFDEIFAGLNPQLLHTMSPLVVLSVCPAVSFEINQHVAERLAWLEIALNITQPHDKDFVEVYPRIMEIVSQRLHKAYMELATEDMNNPLLRKISLLARRANDLQKFTAGMATSGTGSAPS